MMPPNTSRQTRCLPSQPVPEETSPCNRTRPHLILTLRRTGGTSLAGFLGRVSSFPGVQHEPFNPDRIWGETTRAFRESGDREALEAAVAARLGERPNIKHCIEVVPFALTCALVTVAAAHDYRLFVLTRRDEARRIASLELARATGAWGARQAAAIYPEIRAGRRQPRPIDPEVARRRMGQDAAALGRVLALLRHRGLDWQWLVFEELYRGETPIETQARRLAADLGVKVGPDDPRLEMFAQGSGQGSETIAAHVPGYDALKAMLARKAAN